MRSTRLGTGSTSKVNYQRLSAGCIIETFDNPSKPSGPPLPKRLKLSTPAKKAKKTKSFATGEENFDWLKWPCWECGLQCATKSNLSQHLDFCKGTVNGVHSCPVCNVGGFNAMRLVDAHIQEEHGQCERAVWCCYCLAGFPGLIRLRQHLLKDHVLYSPLLYNPPEATVSCVHCLESFSNTEELLEHFESISEMCGGIVLIKPLDLSRLKHETDGEGVETEDPVSLANTKDLEEDAKLKEEIFNACYPFARVGLRETEKIGKAKSLEQRSHQKVPLKSLIKPSSPKKPSQKTKGESWDFIQHKMHQIKFPSKGNLTQNYKIFKSKQKCVEEKLVTVNLRFCTVCNAKFISDALLRKHMLSHSQGCRTVKAAPTDIKVTYTSEENEEMTSKDSSHLSDILNDVVAQSSAERPFGGNVVGEGGSKGSGLKNRLKKIQDIQNKKKLEREKMQKREALSEMVQSGPMTDEPAEESTFEDFMKDIQTPFVAPEKKSPKKVLLKAALEKTLDSASKKGVAKETTVTKAPKGGGYFACPLCSADFSSVSERDVHLGERHQDKKMFACQVCGMCYGQYASLRRHARKHHFANLTQALYGDETWTPCECPLCGLDFSGEQVLISHKLLMHANLKKLGGKESAAKPVDSAEESEEECAEYLCTECFAELPSEAELVNHIILSHSDPTAGVGKRKEKEVVKKVTIATGKPPGEARPSPPKKPLVVPSKTIPAQTPPKSVVQSPPVSKLEGGPVKRSPLPRGTYAPVCCRECRDVSDNAIEFMLHVQEHNPTPPEQTLGCQLCLRVFIGRHARRDLMTHFCPCRPGSEKHICKHCGRTFDLQRQLVSHRHGEACREYPGQLTDIGDHVVYGCPECGRMFAGDEESERYKKHRAICPLDEPANEIVAEVLTNQEICLDEQGNIQGQEDDEIIESMVVEEEGDGSYYVNDVSVLNTP